MTRREIAPEAFLASVPLFKALDASTLARLAAATGRRTLKRGEMLFRRGDPASGMYVVVYGEIKLLTATPTRGVRLSGIVGPGQSFGEPVMFLERAALVDAQADHEVKRIWTDDRSVSDLAAEIIGIAGWDRQSCSEHGDLR